MGHFVDVVWLFLSVSIYWWGTAYACIEPVKGKGGERAARQKNAERTLLQPIARPRGISRGGSE